jgi:hypothetical protein
VARFYGVLVTIPHHGLALTGTSCTCVRRQLMLAHAPLVGAANTPTLVCYTYESPPFGAWLRQLSSRLHMLLCPSNAPRPQAGSWLIVIPASRDQRWRLAAALPFNTILPLLPSHSPGSDLTVVAALC